MPVEKMSCLCLTQCIRSREPTFRVQNLHGEAEIACPDVANDDIEILRFESAVIVLLFRRSGHLFSLFVKVRPELFFMLIMNGAPQCQEDSR